MHPKSGRVSAVSRALPLIALVALGAVFHSTPGAAQSRLRCLESRNSNHGSLATLYICIYNMYIDVFIFIYKSLASRIA